MKKLCAWIIAAIGMVFCLSGCHNKDLCQECDRESGIEIKFDWNGVTQIPDGMTVLFYNQAGELAYTFTNVPKEGEMIRIEAGSYQVACYNNDTEYARWSGFDKLDSLQVTTREGELTEDHTRTGVPETGKLNVMPDFLCGDVVRGTEIKANDPDIQVVLLTPKPLIDIYTYQVSNIENAQYITQIRATLSGLSDRYYLGNPDYQQAATTMPFMGNLAEGNNTTIEGEMQNLGYFRHSGVRNYLTLYLWSPGGNLRAVFDVTDQVHNAPDPHRVNIIIQTTITVPPPIAGDDGLYPSVDEWQDLYFDVIL
ncbi:MAG: DUF5119 domain-containing protein [Bacteroidales bacterium]